MLRTEAPRNLRFRHSCIESNIVYDKSPTLILVRSIMPVQLVFSCLILRITECDRQRTQGAPKKYLSLVHCHYYALFTYDNTMLDQSPVIPRLPDRQLIRRESNTGRAGYRHYQSSWNYRFHVNALQLDKYAS